ncbi:MAG: uracil-DNA glycosylase family protein [Halanaeroarchaeum sp.]
MENVTDRLSNPFDMQPPCEDFVPGYGDANADVHVIGESPERHGGEATGVPFTASRAGRRLQSVLEEVGLIESTGDRPSASNLYLSYLDPCIDDGPDRTFSAVEPFFDAELRAITAHVLVPVGDRVSRHVLERFTTFPMEQYSMGTVHATEISGGGWLVVPLADPVDWHGTERTAARETLEGVLARDYRRESDLGRFLTGPDHYLVR